MHKSKTKNSMRKEDAEHLESMGASELQAVLEEVITYRHPGDMSSKSPFVQGLLKQAEESESGEESIKRLPQELKRHKKPKERRKRKESDSLAARTHAGGSLDNIAGEKAQRVSKQRGVAGRTGEGGSCFNLSRGSFETTVARRRRRRDPHRQHAGSLEDLSAIDETTPGAGRAKSSVSESGKHGGSLQNLQQESGGGDAGAAAPPPAGGDFRPAAAAAAVASVATATAVASVATATAGRQSPPARAAVIEIDAQPEQTVTVLVKRPDAKWASAGVVSPRSAGAAADSAGDGPGAGTETQRPDATVEFPLTLEQRRRAPPYGNPVDLCSVARNVGNLLHTAPYTPEEVEDMPEGERLVNHLRKTQQVVSESGGSQRGESNASGAASAGSGSGGSHSVSNGSSRHATGSQSAQRTRKHKKKEEPQIMTETVEGFRGNDDIETLIGFVESGNKKDKPNGNSNKKSDKAGKKDSKGKKNGVKAAEDERGGGRGAERRPAAGRGSKSASSGRSSSLEARSGTAAAAAPGADASSRFCGDLAKSSLKKSDSVPAPRPAVPTVCSTDGSAYVSCSPAERESDGFVQDFYSVTTDSTAIEETEFHVVTRKQRKRGGATAPSNGGYSSGVSATRGGFGDGGPRSTPNSRHRSSFTDDSGSSLVTRPRPDSVGRPRRPAPGSRQTNSASAPHSELSDSDSDAGETTPAPTAEAEAAARTSRLSPAPPPPSSSARATPATPAPQTTPVTGNTAASSWADVTRSRQENSHPAPAVATSASPAPAAPTADTRDAETSTDFIDGVGPIFGERASPKSRPVAAVSAVVRGASEPTECLIAGSHPDEFPEIAPPSGHQRSATPTQPSGPPPAAAKHPSGGKVGRQAAPGGTVQTQPRAGTVIEPRPAADPVPAASASHDRAARNNSAPPPSAVSVTHPSPVPQPPAAANPARVTPLTNASNPPAAANLMTHASVPANSILTNSVADPMHAVPAANSTHPNPATAPPASQATAGSNQPAQPVEGANLGAHAAATSSAAPQRRNKKQPAVIIRETLQNDIPEGEASLQVHGIRFGYIDVSGSAERPEAAAATAAAAAPAPVPAVAVAMSATDGVAAFCKRFRPPAVVDTSRVNLVAMYAFLGRGYDIASRDPSAFLVSSRSPPRTQSP